MLKKIKCMPYIRMSFRSSKFQPKHLQERRAQTEACNVYVPKGQWWEQQQSVVENMVDNDATSC